MSTGGETDCPSARCPCCSLPAPETWGRSATPPPRTGLRPPPRHRSLCRPRPDAATRMDARNTEAASSASSARARRTKNLARMLRSMQDADLILIAPDVIFTNLEDLVNVFDHQRGSCCRNRTTRPVLREGCANPERLTVHPDSPAHAPPVEPAKGEHDRVSSVLRRADEALPDQESTTQAVSARTSPSDGRDRIHLAEGRRQ